MLPCVCVPLAFLVPVGGQKRMLHLLGLELPITVSYICLGSGNATWVLWKNSQNSQPTSISLSLMISWDDSPVNSRGTGWLTSPCGYSWFVWFFGCTGHHVRASQLQRGLPYYWAILEACPLINSFFHHYKLPPFVSGFVCLF